MLFYIETCQDWPLISATECSFIQKRAKIDHLSLLLNALLYRNVPRLTTYLCYWMLFYIETCQDWPLISATECSFIQKRAKIDHLSLLLNALLYRNVPRLTTYLCYWMLFYIETCQDWPLISATECSFIQKRAKIDHLSLLLNALLYRNVPRLTTYLCYWMLFYIETCQDWPLISATECSFI